MPRSPSTIALEDRPLEELNREELLELARRQRVCHPSPNPRAALLQFLTLIMSQSQEQQALNDKIKVKREREDDEEGLGKSTRAFSTLRPGETIDLTDD